MKNKQQEFAVLCEKGGDDIWKGFLFKYATGGSLRAG